MPSSSLLWGGRKTVMFVADLAVERTKTMEDLRKARRIAHAFRFICPSYYIPGEQDWGAF